MVDLINELFIEYYKWRFCHAERLSKKQEYFCQKMVEHIHLRSPKQIEKMEVAKGLK